MEPPVIGIDVGGSKKGYHAVVLHEGQFDGQQFLSPQAVADWCRDQDARIIGIDAPCAWATTAGSRLAERSLSLGGKRIPCFITPTRAAAMESAFYEWMFNGERLYQRLDADYRRFDGARRDGKIMFETFPHAVVCTLTGRMVPARDKLATRRGLLQALGYDDTPLTNIDFVDAALCAVTAARFLRGLTQSFGDIDEGFIVVPDAGVDFA